MTLLYLALKMLNLPSLGRLVLVEELLACDRTIHHTISQFTKLLASVLFGCTQYLKSWLYSKSSGFLPEIFLSEGNRSSTCRAPPCRAAPWIAGSRDPCSEVDFGKHSMATQRGFRSRKLRLAVLTWEVSAQWIFKNKTTQNILTSKIKIKQNKRGCPYATQKILQEFFLFY